MRVLVVSDTHIPTAAPALPSIILKEAKEADYCFHAGDFVNEGVVKKLASLTEFYGVYGNMDSSAIQNKLPRKQVIELGAAKIALIHGQGSPSALIDFISREFTEGEGIDLFVFGHSHCPFDKEINGKRYFNPGSPTDTVFTQRRSYGILEIENKKITGRLVKIE